MQQVVGWFAGIFGAIGRWLGGVSGPASLPTSEPVSDGPYRDVEAFRLHIFEDYRFTSEARRLLAGTGLVIHNMREPVGGGGWYGPQENRIELQGIQDEAAVHELAHAWA